MTRQPCPVPAASTLDLRRSDIAAKKDAVARSYALRASTFHFSGGGEVRSETFVLVKLEELDLS